MSSTLLPITAASYAVHAIHATDRTWTETNCYVDVWIELLHSLGLNPLVAAAFAVSTDFEGDQWTFFKYPPEDLWAAYGVDVHEMNPWRSPLTHVVEQLELGRLLTVEADSFFLPDTAGVSYRIGHVKSTIVPNMVDAANRRIGYFHNAGYFELEGDDFDGVFRVGAFEDAKALPPYVEIVRLEALHPLSEEAASLTAQALLVKHLARVPRDNPVHRLADRTVRDLEWMRHSSVEEFHLWAFGTLRQCGASAELAATLCGWLGSTQGMSDLLLAADRWSSLSEAAKSLQFSIARAARGRTVDLTSPFAAMADDWQAAQDLMARRLVECPS